MSATPVPNLPIQSACGSWAQPSDISEMDTATITDPNQRAVLVNALQAATDVLFMLTGRQFSGICQDTVRPQTRRLGRDHGRPIQGGALSSWAYGYMPGGFMSGAGYSAYGWCTCNEDETPGGDSHIPAITLGAYPITAIQQVLVNGVALDPSTYRIDNNRTLVRLADPNAPGYPNNNPGWPCTQRNDLPATQPGTWQVTFDYGVPPPPLGIMAAAELGYQLYLAVTPAKAGQSKLPNRVTNITRQGLSAVVLDPQTFLNEGRTGLTLCDYFIEVTNPHGLRRRSTITSPDIGRRVRRTGGM